MSRTILVTGGAGYVGSHACKALAEAGFEPVTYDNLSRGHRHAVRWGPLEEGDLRDGERLEGAIRRHRPLAAMHFAAYAYVGESVVEPALYYDNNVVGSIALLSALRRSGVGHLVFSSTCATYGIPKAVPISESAPQEPVNPYGWTKLMIERAIADHGTGYGLKWMALRYFNACGADPDGEIGEDHDPETHLIPRALMAAAGEIEELVIFGEDYDTPDGTCLRDYIHVADLAAAHVAALKHLLAGGESAACNLGTGHGYSVKEVLSAVERVTGCKLKTARGARRAGDPPALVADPGRAAAILGLVPRRSGIEEIVADAWRWHRRSRRARQRVEVLAAPR